MRITLSFHATPMDSSTSYSAQVSVASERSQRISRTISYYAAFITPGFVSASLGPTLGGLAEHTSSQLRDISFLFTARALGYLVGSFIGGRLYDRIPAHRTMAAVILLMAVLMALVPLTPWLWLLTVVLLLLGMAEATVDVGGNTLLVWTHREQVGPFMNGLHFFFGVGAFLSPIIIAQAVLLSGDITWAYWVLALLIAPVALRVLPLPNPPALVVSKDGVQGQVNPLLVGLIALFFFLYVGAEVSFGGWIFTYTTALKLSDETMARYITSAFWGSLTIGRLLAIPIAARVRPRAMLIADLLGCLASVGIILVWSDSLLAVWLGTLGIGLSMASIFPTTLSFAERRLTLTGQVTGWFFVGAGAGGMVLPWLIGQLFDSVGPRVTMLGIVGDIVLESIVFIVLIVYSSARGRQKA